LERLRGPLIGFVIAAAGVCAHADEVVLRNGDRLTGETVTKTAEALILRTPYAGEISIPWSEVASITSSAPLELLLEGEPDPLTGRLLPAPPGRVLIETVDGQRIDAALQEISFLNPKPYEACTGVVYAGRAALAAAYASGNVDSEHLQGHGELSARAKQHRTQLAARVERRSEAGASPSTGWLGTANHDRFLDEQRFVYVRGSLEHDRAKDLRRRSAAGVGYGTQILESPRASVSVRAGLDYVTETRYVAPGESYPALGWGVQARYLPWGPRLELFHEQDGFRNLERNAVVLRSKSGLRLPLASGISATGQLNVDWESRPAPGRASTDTTLVFGIDYAW
jgi:hypothetical protein